VPVPFVRLLNASSAQRVFDRMAAHLRVGWGLTAAAPSSTGFIYAMAHLRCLLYHSVL
jgi:hypothetical protein